MIRLATNSSREQLSVLFAVAQPTKLDWPELRVEQTFEETRISPPELADKRTISSLSDRGLATHRASVHHGLLGEPGVGHALDPLFILVCPPLKRHFDFSWETDTPERVLRHTGKYLEIDNGVSVLKGRMEELSGMVEMRKDQLEVK